MSIYTRLEEAIILLSQGKAQENIESIIVQSLKDDERLFDYIVSTIDKLNQNKIEMCNYIAVWCYENQMHDYIIPFLQEALNQDPFDKVTLLNLSRILMDVGEYQLAYSYISKIKNKDNEVRVAAEELLKILNSNEILHLEQNDVQFTGERIVVNRLVKEQYSDVLEEHIKRYEMSCEYVKGKKSLGCCMWSRLWIKNVS